jgi:hypothetical protein
MCDSYIVRMMYVGKHISPLLYADVHFGTMLYPGVHIRSTLFGVYGLGFELCGNPSLLFQMSET